MATRFILIRHGQTEWNRGAERFRGRADVLLNATGQQQAQQLTAFLAHEKMDALYVSPMQRTLQTAQPLAAVHKLIAQPHPALLDIDFGELEGLTQEEARAAFPEIMVQWENAPGTVKFPNGESLRAVRARIVGLLDELAEKHAAETVTLVSHKVVCGAMMCVALGLPLSAQWRIKQDLACLNLFERRDSDYVVTLLNCTAHLI